ncbi:uncharacterized protein [Acropora muricata]|uniref:uncharacterized protein n=1 Tax=Acropora muricata TaxID=159855 RepID=UPI0034E3A8FC
MHRDPRYFNVNKHVKICSEHFRQRDFVNPHAKKRRLNRNAVPSKFSWTPVKEEEEEDVERTAVSKLERSRIEQNEATDTASEGEGDELRDLTVTLDLFMDTLKFILPNLDRKLLIYWDSTAGKSSVIDTEKLFEENESDLEEDRNEDEPEIRETKTRPSAHKLQVEDEFLMVLMKLRMGLSNIDLGERFNLSDSAINNILLTWLNYIYEVLGSLKIWPHRDVILKNAPQEFIDKYPNNTVIIDATELKIQVPSALQKQSESYSSYKSHTTFKSLIGVDPNGGIMFISQLYEGSISDKQIVKRSGFLETLKKKIEAGELNKGDSIMADKGFDIGDDLNKIDLKLNIPPFLKDQAGFNEGDVLKTQTIARHRIHVERAIGKVRRFRIFHSVIPVSMFGSVNQIWTVACLLSNFQNPVLA